jgi:hypothetical protein
VTIGRNAPLDEAGWRTISMILVSEKAKYFSERGLTRIRKISPTGKSVRMFCLGFQGVDRENQPGKRGAAPVARSGADFDHFSARLVQYHEMSLFLQPVINPAAVHSA